MFSEFSSKKTVEIRKYLLREESFWHNYLELLPETEEIGASFTWTDDDLELLSGTRDHTPKGGIKRLTSQKSLDWKGPC